MANSNQKTNIRQTHIGDNLRVRIMPTGSVCIQPHLAPKGSDEGVTMSDATFRRLVAFANEGQPKAKTRARR